MRILFGTASFYPEVNGVSTFLQQLAPALKAHGHEVCILAPSLTRKDEKRVFSGVPVSGIRSVTLPMNRQFRCCVTPKLRSLVEAQLDLFRPDVIHVQDPFTINLALVMAAKKRHIPIVATHHTDIGVYEEYYRKIVPRPLRGRIRDVEWMILCWFFTLVDVATAPTRSAANPLNDYGLRKHVHVISNGIDIAAYKNAFDVKIVRKKYGLPEGPLLLSVGRLDPEKKLDIVLKAMVEVKKHQSLHLAIAGKGKELSRLQRMVSRLGLQDCVTLVGFIPDEDIPALYGAADCFVIAGISETQGIVTMEAMAAGLPVIASNALANPELVRHGVNGLLFEPGNITALTQCIIDMFADAKRRKSMGKESLRLIAGHDICKTVDAFEALYSEIITGKFEEKPKLKNK